MNNRAVAIGMVSLGLGMLAFQTWAKPRPSADEINAQARDISGPIEWKDRVAPDFQITLLDGTGVRLSDHVGREVVILNFFATWCAPCRAEMPELQRYFTTHKGEGVLLVAIDAEEKHTAVESFVAGLGLTIPVGIDGDGTLQKLFDVNSYPTTIVIGADGRVKLYETGGISNADVSFGAIVAPELASIRDGRGATTEQYRAALAAEPPRETGSGSVPLEGRARQIAEAMPCPCGCSDTVAACACSVSKAIKARLAKGDFGTKTDVEVMQELNREFCMKPM